MLRAFILAFDHDAAGNMGQANGGVSLVDVLAAGAGCAVGVNTQIVCIDVDFLDLVGFRQHCDGTGGGMNPAL